MELSDDLHCLFTTRIESRNDEAVITVPERELSMGDLEAGQHYRVAVLGGASDGLNADTAEPSPAEDRPVREGNRYEVEIEDIGDQGDGIARVGPGYIVFVPDTQVGDRVTVEITQTRENFAFAEVAEEASSARY